MLSTPSRMARTISPSGCPGSHALPLSATTSGKPGPHRGAAVARCHRIQPKPLGNGGDGGFASQQAIGRLVLMLIVAAVFLCVVLGVVRLQQGYGYADALLSAVTLAVAAIPEEFPVVFTFFLGVGVFRLAQRKALVRRAARRTAPTTSSAMPRSMALNGRSRPVATDAAARVAGAGFGEATQTSRTLWPANSDR